MRLPFLGSTDDSDADADALTGRGPPFCLAEEASSCLSSAISLAVSLLIRRHR
jgi:hypothetical protein